MTGETSPLGEDIGHLEMENQQAIEDFRRPSDARNAEFKVYKVRQRLRLRFTGTGGEYFRIWIVNFLESGWKTALACLLGLFLCLWGFVAAGIPFLAKMAATAVPAAVTDRLSRQILTMLDASFLEPSELGADRSVHLQNLFHGLVDRKRSPVNFRLEFRKSGQVGANAFALPSGLIVMTDELVGLAENDRELIGVMAHEVAHVENRHGLRVLFQNAGTLVLVSALAGDMSSITAAGENLPTLLIESGYSRRFEKEADRAAGTYLIRMGWGTVSLQNILARLDQTAPIHPAFALFSTHPDLEERIGYLKKMDRIR
jgi:Zn-dependent protease with chaperone function